MVHFVPRDLIRSITEALITSKDSEFVSLLWPTRQCLFFLFSAPLFSVGKWDVWWSFWALGGENASVASKRETRMGGDNVAKGNGACNWPRCLFDWWLWSPLPNLKHWRKSDAAVWKVFNFQDGNFPQVFCSAVKHAPFFPNFRCSVGLRD